MLAAIEFQLVKTAQLIAFLGAFRANDPEPRVRPRNGVVPRVGHANHQGILALVHRDHRMVGKDEAGARAREPGEDQPCHHREKTHAGEDFDGGDKMPVVGLRMHVAIADRRQRLDREIEKLQRTFAAGIGNRLVAERR